MRSQTVGIMARRVTRTKSGRTVIASVVCFVAVLTLASCYQNSPSAPALPGSTTTTTGAATTTTTAAATTTTTGPGTTTTTGPGTTTTTTTTTTTSGLVSYATQVHPIWGAQGCSAGGCHSTPGPAPTLSGTPTESCNSLATRDAVNANLIIAGGGAAGSHILTKPQPSGISHVGGSFGCFGGTGSACYDTVLLWLQQGANGPAGTCGG